MFGVLNITLRVTCIQCTAPTVKKLNDLLILHENCYKRHKIKIKTKDIQSSDAGRKQLNPLQHVCTGTHKVWQYCLTFKHKFHDT